MRVNLFFVSVVIALIVLMSSIFPPENLGERIDLDWGHNPIHINIADGQYSDSPAALSILSFLRDKVPPEELDLSWVVLVYHMAPEVEQLDGTIFQGVAASSMYWSENTQTLTVIASSPMMGISCGGFPGPSYAVTAYDSCLEEEETGLSVRPISTTLTNLTVIYK